MGRSKPRSWKVLVQQTIDKAGVVQATVVKVEADYHRVVDGVLVFRNYNGPEAYPTMVRTFAPGHWLEIIGR